MTYAMEILGSTGHLTLEWDPKDTKATAKARKEFNSLKKQGYAFFVTGKPEDEAEQVKTFKAATAALTVVMPTTTRKDQAKKKRAVAVPPMRGG